ncbi:MAG TPA: hypothetical protein VKS01_00455 [Bryobacteraceae bacterium]|nr:hypothetical protein [Bryobacteraceae bacterium]
MRAIKTWWLIIAFVSGFAFAMMAEELRLNWRDNHLELSAPKVHFLSGRPLDLLHNAEAVRFNFNLTMWSGNHAHIYSQHLDQFVVSYDLWKEKFKVVKTQSPSKTVENLTQFDAESWCFSQMSPELPGVGGAEPLWLRLEIRAEDGKDGPLFGRGAGGSVNESGISLSSLIEIFSRPPRQQSHWGPYEVGPFTLDEIKRSMRRGS